MQLIGEVPKPKLAVKPTVVKPENFTFKMPEVKAKADKAQKADKPIKPGKEFKQQEDEKKQEETSITALVNRGLSHEYCFGSF